MSYNLEFNDFSPDTFKPPARQETSPADNVFEQPVQTQKPEQSASQNESDLRDNPILQELGIDFRLLGKKSLGLIPFVPLTQENASAPEMIMAVPVMLITFVFSNAVEYYFGSVLYGAILFKLLIQFLTEGSKQVEFYSILSVLVYGSLPTIISIIIVRYTHFHAVSVGAALLSCLSIGKQMSKGWNLDLLLICGFSSIIGSFWVLFGYI